MPGRQSAFPRDGGRQISFPTVVLRPHGSPGIVESQREPLKWDSGWFFSLEDGGRGWRVRNGQESGDFGACVSPAVRRSGKSPETGPSRAPGYTQIMTRSEPTTPRTPRRDAPSLPPKRGLNRDTPPSSSFDPVIGRDGLVRFRGGCGRGVAVQSARSRTLGPRWYHKPNRKRRLILLSR